MKKILLLTLVISLLLSCNKTKQINVKNIELPANGKEIVEGGNNYGFEVFKEIVETETDENRNIMYSPLSLNSLLYLLDNGAAGATLDEINEVLGIQGIDILNINETYKTIITNLPKVDRDVELSIANSIWANNSINLLSDFSSIVENNYEAEIQNLDKFYLADESSILVPTMELEDTIRFTTAEKCIIVELPYSQGNFVIDLILPQDDNNTDSIINILPELAKMFNELTSAEIIIHLPKFEFKYQSDYLKPIISQKIPTAFSGNADFSKMVSPNMPIVDIVQKTYIKLDEEGTEAAAATAISLCTSAGPPSEINFDKPFIFIIREVSTNTIMFIGKVANPKETE